MVSVLRDIELRLGAGEVMVVEGPSGSGKTTLLAVAGGLLCPDQGRVDWNGTRLGAGTPGRRAHDLGFVFQRPNLLAQLTLRENVLLAAALAGLRPASAGEATDALLRSLDIAALSHRRPCELSGGEEQRAAVARSLVHRPRLVLADEPTASLDGEAALAVAAALIEQARAQGAAVLIATHDPRLARMANRRARLIEGRLHEGT